MIKTKQMCKHAVKKLLFLIKFVPNRYKFQQMCDNAIDNYTHALGSVPYCYKTQKCVTELPVLVLLQYNLFLIDS